MIEFSNNISHKVEFGKNIIIKDGSNIVIIAVGTTLQAVLDATIDLDVSVIYCTTVKPFDFASIQKFLKNKIIVVEPYYSSPVITNIIRESSVPFRSITSIGVPNSFINKYGKKEEIDAIVGLDSDSIRRKVMERINEEE